MSDLRGGEEEREQLLDEKPAEQADDLDLQPQDTGAIQAHHPNGVEAAIDKPKAAPQEEVDTQTETMDFHEDDSPDLSNGTVNTGSGTVDRPSSEQQASSDMSASDLTLNVSPKEGTQEGKLASSGGEGGSNQPRDDGGSSGSEVVHSSKLDQPDDNGARGDDRGVPSPPDQGSDGKGEEGWLDVIGSGQLKKKVVRPGQGLSTRPTPQTRVKMRTKGTLDGGGIVDKHSGVTFTVGDGDVIPAWDLVASLMQRGEVALVRTDPRFAYGQMGRAPDVPPNTSITYELELLEITEPVDFETATEEEVISLVDKKRIRGNELFQRKEFEMAINSYKRALQMMQNYLEGQHLEESESVRDLQIRCWNNLAASQLKANLHKEGLESCEKVLKVDPENVKALFRAGKILSITTTDLDTAVKHLQKAAGLKPEEKAIQAELQKTLRRRDQLKQEEREMYRRMVEGGRGGGEAGAGRKKAPKQAERGPWPYLAAAATIAAIGIGLAYFITQRH